MAYSQKVHIFDLKWKVEGQRFRIFFQDGTKVKITSENKQPCEEVVWGAKQTTPAFPEELKYAYYCHQVWTNIFIYAISDAIFSIPFSIPSDDLFLYHQLSASLPRCKQSFRIQDCCFYWWTDATCCFNWCFWEQLYSQIPHLNGLFPSWTDATCFFKLLFKEQM